MASYKLTVLLLGLLFITGSHVLNAQLFGSRAPPPPPGAGKSVADVICADQELSTFCALIRTARQNPTVAELLDPTFTGTVFAPINKGFDDDRRKLAANTGVASIEALERTPSAAARVVSNHIISGQALQFAQLKNDDKFLNSAGATLEIDTGLLYGKYVKGPSNNVRLRESAGTNNIPAARAYIHKTDGVLVPKKQ